VLRSNDLLGIKADLLTGAEKHARACVRPGLLRWPMERDVVRLIRCGRL
jgi:hypothetical protein